MLFLRKVTAWKTNRVNVLIGVLVVEEVPDVLLLLGEEVQRGQGDVVVAAALYPPVELRVGEPAVADELKPEHALLVTVTQA